MTVIAIADEPPKHKATWTKRKLRLGFTVRELHRDSSVANPPFVETDRKILIAKAAARCFSPPTMSAFIANADYEEKDTDPLKLDAGDEVNVGPADRAWPGWVWASDHAGRDGYVPEEILEPLGEGRFAAIEAFDPTVLTIKRGDQLKSLRQIHGWHWCRNASGQSGWVAGYLLKPA